MDVEEVGRPRRHGRQAAGCSAESGAQGGGGRMGNRSTCQRDIDDNLLSDDACMFCGRPKQAVHTLLFCPYARDVWTELKSFSFVKLCKKSFVGLDILFHFKIHIEGHNGAGSGVLAYLERKERGSKQRTYEGSPSTGRAN
jgi:hypothetical protein